MYSPISGKTYEDFKSELEKVYTDYTDYSEYHEIGFPGMVELFAKDDFYNLHFIAIEYLKGPTMITSEYKTVLAKSKNRELLERAHSTPIDEEAVWHLVYTYLDIDEVEEIRFTSRTTGHANWKKKFLRFNPNKLSVGIVLHEIAHIIVQAEVIPGKKRKAIHGPEFIRSLDELVNSENYSGHIK